MGTAVVLLLLAVTSLCVEARNLTFPDGFLFGAATASYQIEGAWNTSGKGESIWDRQVHTHPECIADQSNGDIAADSYHKYKEDVKVIKEIGLNHYRFSISWPRILPKGDVSEISQEGIDYYNNLIDEVVANNITPVVTIFHWDLPQTLQEIGGMANPLILDYFADYARIVFNNFGDRVKWWITFNEPYQITFGYTSKCSAPGVNDLPGVAAYIVAHNVLKAHAVVYHMYDDEFRSTQNGKVGITLSATWAEPKTQSEADIEAAERYLQFTVGWFAHPIFSTEGDYPAIMKERIGNLSKDEGFYRSRLPEFGEYWVNRTRGTYDFFGLNQYTAVLISQPANSTNSTGISLENDRGNVLSEQNTSWPVGSRPNFRYTPFGLRKTLKWIKDQYGSVDILITENGWSDNGELNDTMRTRFYANYMAATLDAIYEDGVSVIGHTAWSLLDNFSWLRGYTAKFGIVSVNYTDPDRARTAKDSSKLYTWVITNRTIPEEYLDTED